MIQAYASDQKGRSPGFGVPERRGPASDRPRAAADRARRGNRAGGGQFTDAVASLNCAIVAVSPCTEAIFSADSPSSRSFLAKDAVDGCGGPNGASLLGTQHKSPWNTTLSSG